MNEEKLIIDYIHEKRGYHKQILVISCFIWGLLDIYSLTLGLLELRPIVEIKNDQGNVIYQGALRYEYCDRNYEVKSYSEHSLVYYFGIHCDKYLVAFLGSSNFLGLFFGTFISPFLIDHYGRRKPIIIALIIYPISLFASTFVKNIYIMYCFIFSCGFTNLISHIAIFLLLNEVVMKNKRSKYSVTVFNSFAMSGIIFTWSFYFLKNWKYVFYLTSFCVVVLLIFTIFLLKESPRFLLLKEDKNFREKMLERIYKRKSDYTLLSEYSSKENEIFKKLELHKREEQYYYCNLNKENDKDENLIVRTDQDDLKYKLMPNESHRDNKKEIKEEFNEYETANAIANSDFNLIETPFQINGIENFDGNFKSGVKTYKKIFFTMCFMWFCIAGTYHGVLILMKDIKGDVYQTYTVMYMFEMLSNFVVAAMIETKFLGRKKSLIFTFGTSLVIISSFLLFNLEDLGGLFLVSLRFLSTIIFSTIFIYSTEVYPTDIRAKGLAFNAVSGKLSSIIIPFLVEILEEKFFIYCLIVFAIGFVLSFFLIETYGLELKQSSNENGKAKEK